MEPLAHTLVGAAIAESRLGKTTPLAAATLLVGANLPDLDVACYAVSADFALAHRRGWTHGVLAWVVLPLVMTAAVLAYDRWWRRQRDRPPVRAGRILALAALAVATHPALDWLNTYGIRLLAPFDGRWFYGDAVFIVDPWLWLILGGAVCLARSGRGWKDLVLWTVLGAATALAVVGASPLRHFPETLAARGVWLGGLALVVLLRAGRWPVRSGWRSERLAAGALAAAGLYLSLMVASAVAARHLVRAELTRSGVTVPAGPYGLMVGPEPFDPVSREVVAATRDGYLVGRFRWRADPRLTLAPEPLPPPRPSPAIHAALGTPEVQGLVSWMRFPWFEVDEGAEGVDVWILDARYTRRRTTGFGGGVVRLDPAQVAASAASPPASPSRVAAPQAGGSP